MKRKLVIFILPLFLSLSVFSQKTAFVDIKYILNNMQEYEEAQKKLNQISLEWQKEIDIKILEIEKMEKEFKVESIVLLDDVKEKREKEIAAKREELKALQKKRFGKGGDYFMKQKELIKPIQDKIYESIKELSAQSKYAMIFDKSSNATLLYGDEKYNISDKVLKKMGIKPNSK